MKILLSAYACEPDRGSEPGIGWNLALQLARSHEVWVITRSNNEPAIRAELSRNPMPQLRFAYHDLPAWMRWWKRGERGVQLYYYLWQLSLTGVVSELRRDVRFDCVHHITFGRHWMPSGLAGVPVPFVWGPVGGADAIPRPFQAGLGVRGRISNRLRDAARWMGERDPLVRKSARRCSVALATTHATGRRLTALGAKNTDVLPAVALPESEFSRLAEIPIDRPPGSVRFLSVGRLVHWKGFELGIRAFALAGVTSAEYWIVGEGPERARLERTAAALGVDDRVTFMGRVDRSDVFEMLSQSSALVHPSFHDSGGWVCLEAMAAGLPVVCLDLAGPAVLVGTDTGYRIPATSPRDTLARMAEGMRRLAEDEATRAGLGTAARRHVASDHTWPRRAAQIVAVYEQVVAAESDGAA